jgi:hypothetical protein
VGCVTTDCQGKPDFTRCQLASPSWDYNICVSGVCVQPGAALSNPPGPGFARAEGDGSWEYPDTGQKACTNSPSCLPFPCEADGGPAFCGQDGQYGLDANPTLRWTRSSTVEPTVIDAVTGLVWQACPLGRSGSGCNIGSDTGVARHSAISSCDALVWDGYSDWRLPDLHELATILDLSQDGATINGEVFNRFTKPAPGFWTTVSSHDGQSAFSLSFGQAAIGSASRDTLQYVRCVRAGITSTSALPRFARSEPVASSGEYVVADARTGFVWQGCAVGTTGAACPGTAAAVTWQNALATCEGLTWAGSSDWRLPNAVELLSIANWRFNNPVVDQTLFPGASSASVFWSSSAVGQTPAPAWCFDFANGTSSMCSTTAAVRCVRLGASMLSPT